MKRDQQLVKIITESFQQKFKDDPLVVFSPGRINLIGEHTDYNEGFVFPAAIDKGIVLALQKSKEDESSIYARDKDEWFHFSLNTLQPIKNGGWKNYFLGVLAELEKRHLNVTNIDVVFGGNIPDGAGMSSSAALENSFVFALNEAFQLELSKHEMILISQQAEHTYAGVNCGIMDQYASMFGVTDSALLLDCRSITSKTFKIDFEDYVLMLINTNVKHELSESAYNERRSVCEDVSRRLGIAALRDASKDDLQTLKNEIKAEDYQKALYVIEENERVNLFSKAIQDNNLEQLGKLLYLSHNGLSNQYQVSCPELDFLVECAQENHNVLGARMMGGGFGGCTINLIKKTAIEEYKRDISETYKDRFNKACSFYLVNLSQGTHLI